MNQQESALVVLSRYGAMRAPKLCARAGAHEAAMLALQKKGFVRVAGPLCRRQFSLTSAGVSAAKALRTAEHHRQRRQIEEAEAA